MRSVFVAGVGQTTFGKFLDRSVRSLAQEALALAVDDAGLEAGQIEVTFFANALSGLITGQETIRGQVALRQSGVMGRPIINVDNMFVRFVRFSIGMAFGCIRPCRHCTGNRRRKAHASRQDCDVQRLCLASIWKNEKDCSEPRQRIGRYLWTSTPSGLENTWRRAGQLRKISHA